MHGCAGCGRHVLHRLDEARCASPNPGQDTSSGRLRLLDAQAARFWPPLVGEPHGSFALRAVTAASAIAWPRLSDSSHAPHPFRPSDHCRFATGARAPWIGMSLVLLGDAARAGALPRAARSRRGCDAPQAIRHRRRTETPVRSPAVTSTRPSRQHHPGQHQDDQRTLVGEPGLGPLCGLDLRRWVRNRQPCALGALNSTR